jgi:membrane protein YdbS with pleckstrin-like domain
MSAESPEEAELQSAPSPTGPDGREHPLDPRHVTVERIGGWIFFGIVGFTQLVGFLLASLFASDSLIDRVVFPLFGLAIAAGCAWLAHAWPAIAHRYASYRVDNEGIEIKRGVVWRRIISIPRSRVQHTDVSQGPLERNYGLGTLIIYTAGTEHARVQLPGLDHRVALLIRDHLLASGADDVV